MKNHIIKKISTLIMLGIISIFLGLNTVVYASPISGTGSKEMPNTSNSENTSTTIDSTIGSAKKFISNGKDKTIDEDKLKSASDFLYNLLLGIGIIVAVIVGSILGIKYMTGSVEEKAEYKETLIVYLVGCVVVFGAFGIWKIVVNILAEV